MEQSLWQAIARLAPLEPHFVSVTYGAGGSTRERTHATVKRILAETMLTPAAHLTCVAASRAEVDEVVAAYAQAGVRHIVALRGDPPGGVGERYAPHPEGYRNAAELVAGIKRIADIEVSVSAYPEKHPDSRSLEADIDMLAAKVDAGASPRDHAVLLRECRLFPLSRPRAPTRHRHSDRARNSRRAEFRPNKKLRRPLRRRVPAWLAARFDGLDDDPATRKLIAAAVAAEQVLDLVDHGVSEFHFYTMNRADLVYAICHLLGVSADTSVPRAHPAEAEA